MHALCFIEMSSYLETQANLKTVFAKWSIAALEIKCRRFQKNARLALGLVRKWQRSEWELWIAKFVGHWALRRCFELWRRETHEPPSLISDSGD